MQAGRERLQLYLNTDLESKCFNLGSLEPGNQKMLYAKTGSSSCSLYQAWPLQSLHTCLSVIAADIAETY